MKFDLQLLDFVECDKGSEKLAISASDKNLTWNEFKNEVEKLKIETITEKEIENLHNSSNTEETVEDYIF